MIFCYGYELWAEARSENQIITRS